MTYRLRYIPGTDLAARFPEPAGEWETAEAADLLRVQCANARDHRRRPTRPCCRRPPTRRPTHRLNQSREGRSHASVARIRRQSTRAVPNARLARRPLQPGQGRRMSRSPHTLTPPRRRQPRPDRLHRRLHLRIHRRAHVAGVGGPHGGRARARARSNQRNQKGIVMTHMFDLFNEADFDRAVAEKLLTIRDDRAGLRILNYSDAAMYTAGSWSNPAVRACRGLIVDDGGHIVARPWAKFFNHGQAEAGTLDMGARVEVTDKLDGSLGIVHRDLGGELKVATRGSFESDQAIHATDLIRSTQPHLRNLDLVTPLVEIVYPANRIVVDYGDTDDLILLGGVVITTGEYLGPDETAAEVGWDGSETRVFEYATLADALAAPPRPGMEGLAVRYVDRPHIVKIKQEEYVRLHKIVTGLSERSVWEHMTEGKPLNDMLAELPDELHEWTRDVWAGLRAAAAKIGTEARLTHIEIVNRLGETCSRKDYAEAAMGHPTMRPYLFNLLDGRDPHPTILKTLKPVGQTHARVVSEATA